MQQDPFATRLARLRPALIRLASKRLNVEDAEDAVQETFAEALTLRNEWDKHLDDTEIGRRALRILDKQTARVRRSQRLCKTGSLEELSEHIDRMRPDDERAEWAVLDEAPQQRAAEEMLRHEARYRLRHTDLSPDERVAIVDRLNGVTQAVTARKLRVRREQVARIVRRAIEKLRACPIRSEEIDTDAEWLFLYCSKVPIYRKPVQPFFASQGKRRRTTYTGYPRKRQAGAGR